MGSKSLLMTTALAVVVFAMAAPVTFAQNLLTNGSFETSDFTGWTTGGNFTNTEVVSGAFYVYPGAQDGNFYAILGPVGSDGTLSQSFSDQAGHAYTFGFWLAAIGDSPSDFTASWDGNTVYSATNPNTGDVWTQFTFTETGTGHDTISFAFRDDPAFIAFDNVSVTPVSGTSVPEPSSFLLMGSGVLGLAGVIRRKVVR